MKARNPSVNDGRQETLQVEESQLDCEEHARRKYLRNVTTPKSSFHNLCSPELSAGTDADKYGEQT